MVNQRLNRNVLSSCDDGKTYPIGESIYDGSKRIHLSFATYERNLRCVDDFSFRTVAGNDAFFLSLDIDPFDFDRLPCLG